MMPVERRQKIGSFAPTWERWRLAGVFWDEAFPASTRRRDGSAPRITTAQRWLFDGWSKA